MGRRSASPPTVSLKSAGTPPNVFYSQRYARHGLNVTHWAALLLALGTLWYRRHKALG
ncbi:hypothetical protein PPUN109347_43820 [Pseudomonas putida]|nr:hypothetical protein PPUN109347_43820 [Pseudomonas putida]HDS0982405.1 hypothetical protein [Pseudomonas putida]